MSNSALVNYTKISPNRNSPRNTSIKKITIHHMAGNLTIEQCGEIFAKSANSVSSNYGIGTDGRVGMYVEEKDRSWCTSSRDNDHQAITIEVANDGGSPDWHVSDKAIAKLIDLCTDICKRNGIKKLNYTGDKSGNLTMHKWFKATACPGPYLSSKFPYIAEQVNKRITTVVATPSTSTAQTKSTYTVKILDDCLNIRKGAGTNYPVAGQITNHGVYTIVETKGTFGKSGSWGKLKSGAGWISLYSGYVKKV